MRNEPIQRLRRLRARAHALGRNLAQDLTRFLHEKDGCTIRRLPNSVSKEGDVNVACTCTALMALGIANGLRQFYHDPDRDHHDADKDHYVSQTRTAFELAVSAPWTSSQLPEGNAFTAGIVLRTAGILSQDDKLGPLGETDRPSGERVSDGKCSALRWALHSLKKPTLAISRPG